MNKQIQHKLFISTMELIEEAVKNNEGLLRAMGLFLPLLGGTGEV